MSAKEPTMTRAQLSRMLAVHGHVKAVENGFEADESAALELLVKGGGGAPTPLAKVERITFEEDFVTVRTAESLYSLSYGLVLGVKLTPRGDKHLVSRAGFLR